MKKIMQIIQVILCAVLCVGVKLVFHACGKHADGTYGSCHTAENVVFVIAILLTALAVLQLVVKQKTVGGILGCLISLNAIAAAVIPGTAIKLCMMEDMHCNSMMKPAVRILGILITVTAVINAVLRFREKKETA